MRNPNLKWTRELVANDALVNSGRRFTPRVFDAYHSRGARVLAYLPNNLREIERTLRAGADEVILDFAYDRMRSTP